MALIVKSNHRYNRVMINSPFAFVILKGKKLFITLANCSVKKIWGKGEFIEKNPLIEVLRKIKTGPLPGLLEKVFTTGIPYQVMRYLFL